MIPTFAGRLDDDAEVIPILAQCPLLPLLPYDYLDLFPVQDGNPEVELGAVLQAKSAVFDDDCRFLRLRNHGGLS